MKTVEEFVGDGWDPNKHMPPDGHVRLIDPEKVEVTQDIPAFDGWAYSIAVHPTDGRIVVGGVAAGLRQIRIQTDQ